MADASRRELLRQYSITMQQATANVQALHQPENVDAVLELQRRVNQGLDQVRNTREAVIDSEAFRSTSGLALEQTINLRVNQEPTVDDFANKVLEKYGSLSEGAVKVDWLKMGQDVCKHWRTAPFVNFLFGPLKLAGQEPVRKERAARRKEDDPTVLERPDLVSGQPPRDPQQETLKRVRSLHQDVEKRLHTVGEETVSFPEAFIDKTSFARSAENLFHASFLVNHGQIGMKATPQPSNIHDIRVFIPMNSNGEQAPRSQATPAPANASRQCIIRFNRDLFEKWCRSADSSVSSSSLFAAPPTASTPNPLPDPHSSGSRKRRLEPTAEVEASSQENVVIPAPKEPRTHR
eukprot:GGOE01004810.1.p1 GENE.GGOE01004810.1~~GGOE01004810.1.p1  ORF type:complete len:349 (+),score=82.65 GGOE01004810.1:135-1181(+)